MVAMSRQAEAPRRHFLLRAASFTTSRVLSLIAGSPCSTIGASANLDSLIDTVQVVLGGIPEILWKKKSRPKFATCTNCTTRTVPVRFLSDYGGSDGML
jgi:hypothetical protein